MYLVCCMVISFHSSLNTFLMELLEFEGSPPPFHILRCWNWRNDRTCFKFWKFYMISSISVSVIQLQLWITLKVKNLRSFVNVRFRPFYSILSPSHHLTPKVRILYEEGQERWDVPLFGIISKSWCDVEYTKWSNPFFLMFFWHFFSILQLLTLAYLEHLVKITENLGK